MTMMGLASGTKSIRKWVLPESCGSWFGCLFVGFCACLGLPLDAIFLRLGGPRREVVHVAFSELAQLRIAHQRQLVLRGLGAGLHDDGGY